LKRCSNKAISIKTLSQTIPDIEGPTLKLSQIPRSELLGPKGRRSASRCGHKVLKKRIDQLHNELAKYAEETKNNRFDYRSKILKSSAKNKRRNVNTIKVYSNSQILTHAEDDSKTSIPLINFLN